MTRRHLHLMAEYGDTFPVWERTPGLEPGPVDPEECGFSDQLRRDLAAWNAQWETLVAGENGTASERREWKREGKALAKRIGVEAGHRVRVTYQP